MVFWRYVSAPALLCLMTGMVGGTALASDASMTLGAPTKQPIGHYRLCQSRPDECRRFPGIVAGPIKLDAELMRLVAKVNSDTNTEIKPKSDQELYGVEENWTYPVNEGDCEDYALLKRKRLAKAGIPLSDLLITVVRKRDNTGHAVLTLRSTTGDFILDNLDMKVRSWTDTPYRYVKRQDSDNPGRWISIDENDDPVVSAATR